MDKHANGVIVDILLLLDNGPEDLGTGGVVPEVFLDILPKLKRDGHEHRFPVPIDMVTVGFAYREIIYFYVTNHHSCKGLDPLRNYPVFS